MWPGGRVHSLECAYAQVDVFFASFRSRNYSNLLLFSAVFLINSTQNCCVQKWIRNVQTGRAYKQAFGKSIFGITDSSFKVVNACLCTVEILERIQLSTKKSLFFKRKSTISEKL